MTTHTSDTAHMIAIDWGTTNCRATLLDAKGDALETRQSPEGAGGLNPSEFEAVFDRIVDGWPDVPAWVCGMAGSRQGWQEALYLACPTALGELATQTTPIKTSSGRSVQIVSGLLFEDGHGQADIMRGEETQIAGLLASQPDFVGLAIMPGTHCKWVEVRQSRVLRFQTFLTGELYALLATHSILRHSLATDSKIDANNPAFLKGLDDTFSGKVPLMSGLFQIRAQDVLNNVQQEESAARLSGMMIGAEFAAAKASGLLNNVQNACIIGGSSLAPLYAKACENAGLNAKPLSGLDISTAGLWNLAQQQSSSTR
ncbi:MAG: 2-dehydro-3-deoxygalactonokinase [Rhizobiales bacterium]|nr:2-dehydro-3-deoxygalactonokinase [Hyphomicrobiales bacterium]